MLETQIRHVHACICCIWFGKPRFSHLRSSNLPSSPHQLPIRVRNSRRLSTHPPGKVTEIFLYLSESFGYPSPFFGSDGIDPAFLRRIMYGYSLYDATALNACPYMSRFLLRRSLTLETSALEAATNTDAAAPITATVISTGTVVPRTMVYLSFHVLCPITMIEYRSEPLVHVPPPRLSKQMSGYHSKKRQKTVLQNPLRGNRISRVPHAQATVMKTMR